MCLAESSVTATARLVTEVLWAGMWKDLYCFALRIDMVLPDWRGFIGLVPWQHFFVSACWTDRFETRSTATHPERDMAQLKITQSLFGLTADEICCVMQSAVCLYTFVRLLCARRESPKMVR